MGVWRRWSYYLCVSPPHSPLNCLKPKSKHRTTPQLDKQLHYQQPKQRRCMQHFSSTIGIAIADSILCIIATIITFRTLVIGGQLTLLNSKENNFNVSSIERTLNSRRRFLRCCLHGRHYSSLLFYYHYTIGSNSNIHHPTWIGSSQDNITILFLQHCNIAEIDDATLKNGSITQLLRWKVVHNK